MVLSFPYTGSLTFVAFVAWIPLLLVEAHISAKRYRSGKVLLHAYISFFIYNVGATWWVIYASSEGASLAFILNSLIMALVFYLFHLTKKHVGSKEGYIALIIYWIAFEYFHFNWESSWPWLTLGNVFSIHPSWVQWYSYSGTLGGSLWVLVINLLLFRAYSNVLIKGESWKIQTPLFYLAGFFLIVPLSISLISYYNYTEQGREIEVVAVQPNIDPYNEKFETGVFSQVDKMLQLAAKKVTKNTELIVGPETAISQSVDEDRFGKSGMYKFLESARSQFNNPVIYIGASTHKFFDVKHSSASQKVDLGGGYYESYNTSLMLEDDRFEFIHKSKLVPGVEKIPFTKYLPFLEDLSIDLGGTRGTLGVEKEPRVFRSKNFSFAPVVCYESIFGEFVSIQCRKGAQLICIVTNDGWWRDTPGYKQHMSFARLRAIENRRDVVRSANTGTSCFIDQRGDSRNETDWWVPDVIKSKVRLNNNVTFYTTYGNVMGRSFSFVGLLLILYTFVKRFKRYVINK